MSPVFTARHVKDSLPLFLGQQHHFVVNDLRRLKWRQTVKPQPSFLLFLVAELPRVDFLGALPEFLAEDAGGLLDGDVESVSAGEFNKLVCPGQGILTKIMLRLPSPIMLVSLKRHRRARWVQKNNIPKSTLFDSFKYVALVMLPAFVRRQQIARPSIPTQRGEIIPDGRGVFAAN